MKNVVKQLISRVVLFILPLLIQIVFIAVVLIKMNENYIAAYVLTLVAGVIFVIAIINGERTPYYKLAWIIPILVFPVFGVSIYLMFGRLKSSRETKRIVKRIDQVYLQQLPKNPELIEEIRALNPKAAKQAKYLEDYGMFPVQKNSSAEYFPSGEAKFERLLEELKKAEHYIFLEYFIIQEGEMWGSILEILGQKAAEGVDVRVLYDDMGSIFTIPYKFKDSLKECGIKCKSFNPCKPVLSAILNNRDHRKIVVIDGCTAFTGGINLADEYINKTKRFGHWKDSAVMITGEAVWNFTVMFLSLWEERALEDVDFEQYRPHFHHRENFEDDGYILPYSDSPLDGEPVGSIAYINMINAAEKYVYINTPYLIIDNEMQGALCNAAKSGVDVRIITPGIPDKKTVFILTRSYYKPLVEAGVKIYEYSPGFMHAKSFVCDDEVAIVGTINLDYRSLYLHFECAAWMYKTKCIADIKADFLETQEKCRHMDKAYCDKISKARAISTAVLKLFAPLF